MRYFAAIIVFAAAVVAAYFGASFFLNRLTWHADDPLYVLFKTIERYASLVIPAVILLGVIAMAYRQFTIPLGYVEELLDAAEQLSTPTETPIRLSSGLADAQNQLNLARETALRNAARAREAEQRKNDLIVYLAHDLKTPLTSVIGYLTLLRDEPQISGELRCRYTGIALEKAERLEELINEFFDITRFNLTAISLAPERINLSRMLEQITYEFNPILAEKSLRWRVDIAPGIEIVADPDKLERVFDNLIRNAVNYSYSDTEIALSMRKANGRIEIEVQNHGKTIPEDKLERIFEQFFRYDAARSSATGGAGLGLAIAKELVELHHGVIDAQSAGERIVFTVVLPVDCAAHA